MNAEVQINEQSQPILGSKFAYNTKVISNELYENIFGTSFSGIVKGSAEQGGKTLIRVLNFEGKNRIVDEEFLDELKDEEGIFQDAKIGNLYPRALYIVISFKPEEGNKPTSFIFGPIIHAPEAEFRKKALLRKLIEDDSPTGIYTASIYKGANLERYKNNPIKAV